MGGNKLRWCERILDFCGLCLLAIAFIIGIGVLMNLLGLSRLVNFERSYWLVGQAVTFNSLMGLQVLLFFMAIMLAISPVLLLDRHVRVDVLHARLSRSGQRWLELIGHLGLAMPFFALLLGPSWRFAERAFLTGESSTDGGLTDLYVIKALLPLGIVMFLGGLLIAIVTLLRGRTPGEVNHG
ncbi:TRAP transporter small permease subunit [Vreelandella titanicae]|uniref:TRAP transporter small permease subunit n=1 Tax=Vreelandella titanicae TaxID=664683 RepID=UPI0013732AFB|nr:TRAP transporter small permease subunit [Halomonas sp. MG34]